MNHNAEFSLEQRTAYYYYVDSRFLKIFLKEQGESDPEPLRNSPPEVTVPTVSWVKGDPRGMPLCIV